MLGKLVLKTSSCKWTLHTQHRCPPTALGPQPKKSVTKREEKKTSPVRKCLDKGFDRLGWAPMPIPGPITVSREME